MVGAASALVHSQASFSALCWCFGACIVYDAQQGKMGKAHCSVYTDSQFRPDIVNPFNKLLFQHWQHNTPCAAGKMGDDTSQMQSDKTGHTGSSCQGT